MKQSKAWVKGQHMSISPKYLDSFIATHYMKYSSIFSLYTAVGEVKLLFSSGDVHFSKKLLKAVICDKCSKWKE